MKTTSFVSAALAAFVLSTSAALAADPALFADSAVVQTVTAQLEAQGFIVVDVERTLLGRYKIEAISADGVQRELVISANNEVLRDQIDQVAVQGYNDDVAGADLEDGTDNEVDGDNENDGQDSNNENDTDNHTGNDTDTGADTDSGNDTGTDTDSGSDAGTDTDTDSGDDNESESDDNDGPDAVNDGA